MDFSLTEDHKMLQQSVRDFAREVLRPKAAEVDATGEFPREQVRQMAALGLMGICMPETYGGAGMDSLAYALAVEEVAWGDAACSVVMSVNNSLVCEAIYKMGSEELKKTILPPLARGDEIGCFCLSEPGSGSDAGSLKTRADKQGNDYILNGSKIFITSGGQAQRAIVMAATDPAAGKKGISCFVVDCNSPGMKFGPPEHKMGLHGSHTTEMHMENVKVPASRLIGKEGDGFKIALMTLDCGRIGIAAQALGIARAALEESLKYAKERQQFGKPIAEFQAIQFKLSDMATELDAARLLVWRAAVMKGQGLKMTREAAMAKLKASEVCRMVTREAVQIHGGYGYTKEFPVERFYRDGRITEIYEGTSEIQRLVIARDLLGS
ncbi:MAG: acyl-CoA dehydrogenase [Planctomycetota bacterium]